MKYRSSIWRRLGALLMCLVLLALTAVALIGCETPSEPPVYDTRLNFLTNSGISIYRIVYPKTDCPAAVLEAAQELQSVMTQVLRAEVAMTDDHDSANADDGLQPYEILIGSTARSETQNVLSALGEDEYIIRVEGHKIVIAGESNRATVVGVRRFISQILGYADGQPTLTGAEIKIEADFDVKGWYEITHLRNDIQDTTLPNAPFRALTLYAMPMPTNPADMLTAATLQGLIAMQGSEQIYLVTEQNRDQLAALRESGVAVYEQTDDELDWTTARLLNYYADRLRGYILCSSDFSNESLGVAVSLAHHLGAVIVTAENESVAQAAGLSCVLDVTDKDDAWLRSSNYFSMMNKAVAVELSVTTMPALIDYVVMTGCYYYDYTGMDEYMHLQQFKFLDDGACLLTENAQVSARALSFETIGVNVCLIPETYAYNMSVLSGCMPHELDEALFSE